MLLLYLVARVGMEECSLDLDRPFVLLVVGWGLFFLFQQLKLEFC